jgi:glycosyltransferase involved in cell wall biosynthesis
MLRHVPVFVGHSETNLTSFEPAWRDHPGRFRVIYNGIAFPESEPNRVEGRRKLSIREEQTVLLHVGSFRPEKNHEALLDIAARVFRRVDDGLLLMVGEGELRQSIEARALDLGLADRVRFEGGRKDVWPYYSAADVLVFPSTTEGFGNALVEAQGFGLPVVASDIPAHRESVAKVQREFLFEIGNVHAAADLVIRQLESAAAGNNAWLESSRNNVRSRFSVDRSADFLADLYAEVITP